MKAHREFAALKTVAEYTVPIMKLQCRVNVVDL